MSAAADNKSFDDISKEQEKLKKQQEASRQERARLVERAREIEEEKKNAPVKLKTRPVPAVVTLIGGAAAAVVCVVRHLDLQMSLIVILISLCVFLILGDIIKVYLDKIEIPPVREIEEGVDSEGEMIEKSSAGEDDGDMAGQEGQENGPDDNAG